MDALITLIHPGETDETDEKTEVLRKLKAPAEMNSRQQEREASRPQISSQSGITNMTGSRSAYTTASASPYTVHTDRETMTG